MTPTFPIHPIKTDNTFTLKTQVDVTAQVPHEMMTKIFQFLKQPSDLASCNQVCKKWTHYIDNLFHFAKDPFNLNFIRGVYASCILKSHSKEITSLVLSPDGKKLFSGSFDHTIKVWNVQTRECSKTLLGHENQIMSLGMSADGDTLFSSSYDQTTKIWDTETGNCLHTFQDTSDSLILSANGKLISGSFGKNMIQIWDIQTNICSHILQGHADSCIFAFVLSADGKKLVSNSTDGQITIWDVETGERSSMIQGPMCWMGLLALSANGKTLFSSASNHIIHIWNVETGDCLGTLQGPPNSYVTSLIASADGATLFTGIGIDKSTSNYLIQAWDIHRGICSYNLEGHSGQINLLIFSKDEKKLFSSSFDTTIKIWDIEGKVCLSTLQSQTGKVISLILSADEKKLFCSSDHTIKIWQYDISFAEVLKEIADLFKENNQKSAEHALERFEKLLPKVKNAIYKELYCICEPSQKSDSDEIKYAFYGKNQQISTSIQKAKAIMSYLTKKETSIF